jgi:hypothetical protein
MTKTRNIQKSVVKRKREKKRSKKKKRVYWRSKKLHNSIVVGGMLRCEDISSLGCFFFTESKTTDSWRGEKKIKLFAHKVSLKG